MREITKGAKAGQELADALINWAHLFYQKDTAQRVLRAMISHLQKRLKEFERSKNGQIRERH